MLGLLSNPWVLIGGAVVVFSAGFGTATSFKNGEIARLELKQAKGEIQQRDAALKDLADASANIAAAANNFQKNKDILAGKIDAIRKDLKNAPPLPPGCLLDDERMRKLDAAAAQVNETRAGQRASGTVPADKRP